jgi:hypothetical protein
MSHSNSHKFRVDGISIDMLQFISHKICANGISIVLNGNLNYEEVIQPLSNYKEFGTRSHVSSYKEEFNIRRLSKHNLRFTNTVR